MKYLKRFNESSKIAYRSPTEKDDNDFKEYRSLLSNDEDITTIITFIHNEVDPSSHFLSSRKERHTDEKGENTIKYNYTNGYATFAATYNRKDVIKYLFDNGLLKKDQLDSLARWASHSGKLNEQERKEMVDYINNFK